IKQEIRTELNLTASVGVGPNKFIAKVASDLKKPDGLVVVDPKHVQPFLDPLPVSRLWGVGKVADQRLGEYGIRTIGQLRRMKPDFLENLFGNWGEQLYNFSHGKDDRGVVPDHEAKSISHETTFPEDQSDLEALREWLMELTDQVARRLRRQGLSGKTVQIKIRFSDFRTMTRSRSLKRATNMTRELWKTASGLLTSNLSNVHPGVRLLGMGVQGLTADQPVQRELFDEGGEDRQRRIDEATDQIKERFGKSVIRRGT
ncbi:MAG TPA: DNA polymerase IV, partial [Nitrospiria bacterium]|nr:DNA polymerase IV [Nitrospiria bacterium]